MNNTELGFFADIVENPDDDGLRLMYADWCEEQGRDLQAEFIRLQIEAAATRKQVISDEFRYRIAAKIRDLVKSVNKDLGKLVRSNISYSGIINYADINDWRDGSIFMTSNCYVVEIHRGFPCAITSNWSDLLDSLVFMKEYGLPLNTARFLTVPSWTTYPSVWGNQSRTAFEWWDWPEHVFKKPPVTRLRRVADRHAWDVFSSFLKKKWPAVDFKKR